MSLKLALSSPRHATILPRTRLISTPPPAPYSTRPPPTTPPYSKHARSTTTTPPDTPSSSAAQYTRPLLSALTVFLAAHLFFDYCYTLRATTGPSMLPTFAAHGDWVLISNFARHGAGVGVGDIVSFRHPMHRGERAMKRIVGMPGDFVMRDTPGKAGAGWMLQVPEGYCWVAGDNLEWSRDSRMFGPLPLALVRGRAVARVTPGWPPRVQWFRGAGDMRKIKDAGR